MVFSLSQLCPTGTLTASFSNTLTIAGAEKGMFSTDRYNPFSLGSITICQIQPLSLNCGWASAGKKISKLYKASKLSYTKVTGSGEIQILYREEGK